ncbi:EamA family transporter [Streptomyces sp. NBC_01775]|uniref:DMT family transporter n=1 Tax=Streptomyces sp. NBC_01775 TaxID=2975939 RepID=UPI002DDBAD41|nr:EamA family transporter [Streptomyces sp. NBC_01775]WSB78171.1 EamA family transporter [Streptomyces sp. NBC_01775]
MKSRIDPLSMAAMMVTVVSFSATAPLTAYASASPLAMAFWRNFLGFATLGPLLLLLRRREVVRVARGERGLLRREQWRPLVFGFLAATALACHFAAFMTSTRLTSVAMSTALVATQPVWQALIARTQGARASRRTWAGLALSVVGAVAATGLDLKAGGTALLGDALALAGAIALAGYTALSEKARPGVSTPLYSTVTSLICGLELLAVCWLAGIPLTGFDQTTHLSLLGLLILPQLLGLGSMNFALGRTSATTMSVLLLLEAPVAALTAWWLLGQHIEIATLPGLLLIIVGVMVVVTSGGGERAAAEEAGQLPGTLPYPAHPPYEPYGYEPRLQPAGAVSVASVGPAASVASTASLAGAAERSAPERSAPERSAPARILETARATPPQRPPLRHGARPDPRVDWARCPVDDSPTVTFSHPGVGAFDTMYLRRPHVVKQNPAASGGTDRPRDHTPMSARVPDAD